jgi:hypothetical protein
MYKNYSKPICEIVHFRNIILGTFIIYVRVEVYNLL